MFGANFVTSFDSEFFANANLIELLDDMGVSTLRFPGGTVTEVAFTEAAFVTGNWNASTHTYGDGIVQQITPLNEFFSVAGQIGSNVQLVLPTRVAFQESAGQAIANGTYGQRTALDSAYFQQTRAFIEQSLLEAAANGIEVTRFEIGNEFWGGGEMTANEYGHIAAQVTVWLNAEFPGIDIIAQVAASANLFSPRYDRVVHLEPDGSGDYTVHFPSNDQSPLPSGWVSGTMPGSGNAAEQTRTIADHFNAVPGAAEILDGIVEHVYFQGGFDGVDGERDYALNSIYNRFIERLGVDDIDYFVTEWSARNPRSSDDALNLGNENGLHYAHSTIEAFFELVSNGVDGANFWPMTFGYAGAVNRTLIDTIDEDYTFGGVALQWLAESTLGLSALFDFEVSGQVDVHGYGDEDTLVMFVGERSGTDHTGGGRIELDLADFALDGTYFVVESYLNSDDGSFDDNWANPVVTFSDGYVSSSDIITFELAAWDLAKIELQLITSGSDEIHGGGGSDAISGLGGNDRLNGYSGDDVLDGGTGNDDIFGGEGDDVLFGGAGDDTLQDGEGADYFNGGAGNDLITLQSSDVWGSGWAAYNAGDDQQVGTNTFVSVEGFTRISSVVDGGTGIDTLRLSDASEALFLQDDVTAFNEEAANPGQTQVARLANIEIIEALGGDDLIDLTNTAFGQMQNGLTVDGGSGNDVIWGTSQDETLRGGSGNDIIFGGAGADNLSGGSGADVFEFTMTSVGSTITDFNPFEGDEIHIFDRGGATFDPSSLQVTQQGIDVSYYKATTGWQSLSIALDQTALLESISNQDLMSSVSFIEF